MPQKPPTIHQTWQHRAIERTAYLYTTLLLTLGALTLHLTKNQPPTWNQLTPIAAFALALTLIHLTLTLTRHQADPTLTIPIALLAAIGILTQHRLQLLPPQPPHHWTHLTHPIALTTLLLTATLLKQNRYQTLQKLRPLYPIAALLTLTLINLLGTRYRGAIYAPGNLTLTEPIKILTTLYLAAQLTPLLQKKTKNQKKPPWQTLLPILLYYTLLLPLLLWQRDLGMALTLIPLALILTTIATHQYRWPLITILTLTPLALLTTQHLPHTQQRIQTWLNPYHDPTGASWQPLQALAAMFTGGLWGTGIGQANPHQIPLAATDFTYALIAEELGYTGTLLITTAYLLLLHRAYRAAKQTNNPFGALLTIGLTTTIAIQTTLNIAGVTKTLPLTGIPLPLISHGGTNLITTLTTLGIILAIADTAQPTKKTKPTK